MFALFATERNWLALSQPDLPVGTPVVGTVGWAAFLSLAPAAECCMVAIPPMPTAGLYDALRAFRRSLPFMPLVLVAERSLPGDVGALGEVIRPPLRLRHLWPAIQRACTVALLEEAATTAAAAYHRPSTVRRAFAMACRAMPPITSVAALAEQVGRHRHTLWAQWRTTGPLAEGCTLDDLLDWVLLLRGCAAWTPKRSWSSVAPELGVHRHTLARVAATLGHLPLRELLPDAGPRLRDAFRRGVLQPFLAMPDGAPPLHEMPDAHLTDIPAAALGRWTLGE